MNTKRRSSPSKSKAHKGRRPRFLSLRLQFPVDDGAKQIQLQATGVDRNTGEASETAAATSEQLNLFPLQPENFVEDRENNDHENVAFFFSVGDAGASSTLTGLLDHSTAEQSISSNTNNSSRVDCLPPSSPASLRHEYCQEKAALERNALRNRDRDSIEEKWVCYSEVVKEEEVTSCAIDPPRPAGIRRVKLKLDYEEIMNAWSDKGPLYIDEVDNTQIVPDISHHFLSPTSNYSGLSFGCNVSHWIVPEFVGDIENNVTMNMRSCEDYVVKMGHREASVLRYKEKRQNRLFSKKIRYQVRKLNAEKRPRLKGRFVKRL